MNWIDWFLSRTGLCRWVWICNCGKFYRNHDQTCRTCPECAQDLKTIESIDYYGHWGYVDAETKTDWKNRNLL